MGLDEVVPLRPGAVVELDRGGDDHAAAGQVRVVGPGEPVLEDGANARLAPGRRESRADHLVLEALGRRLEDLELELVLGPEMGEESALRQPQLGRQGADRQPLEAVAARQLHRLVEDPVAGLGALTHTGNNTNGRSILQAA